MKRRKEYKESSSRKSSVSSYAQGCQNRLSYFQGSTALFQTHPSPLPPIPPSDKTWDSETKLSDPWRLSFFSRLF
jgi:hypothetical protein